MSLQAHIKESDGIHVEEEKEYSQSLGSGWRSLKLERNTGLKPGHLQISGPKTPSRISTLPPSQLCRLLVRTDEARKSIVLRLGSADPVANSIFGYLRCGDVESAHFVSNHLLTLWETKHGLVEGTGRDKPSVFSLPPFTGRVPADPEEMSFERMVVAVMTTMSSSNMDRVRKWTSVTHQANPDSPDAHILKCWQNLVDEVDLEESTNGLLHAANLGPPVFTTTLKLLLEGLDHCREKTESTSVSKVLSDIRKLATATDWTNPMLSFLGSLPDRPTESPSFFRAPQGVSVADLLAGSQRIPEYGRTSPGPSEARPIADSIQRARNWISSRLTAPEARKRWIRPLAIATVPVILLLSLAIPYIWSIGRPTFPIDIAPKIGMDRPTILIGHPEGCLDWFGVFLGTVYSIDPNLDVDYPGNVFESCVGNLPSAKLPCPPRISMHLNASNLKNVGELLGVSHTVRPTCRQEEGEAFSVILQVENLLTGEISRDSILYDKDIYSLATLSVASVRKVLNLRPLTASEESVIRGVIPPKEAFWSFFSDGVSKLRLHQAQEAQKSLELARDIDPNNPLVLIALSEMWSLLGYDKKAEELVRTAWERRELLPYEERLLVEGRYHEVNYEWPKAIKTYSRLWQHYPKRVEFGLKLANAQISGGSASRALSTADKLMRISKHDPRIALVEARAAELVSDIPRLEKAVERALNQARALDAEFLEARALKIRAENSSSLAEAEGFLARVTEIYKSNNYLIGQAEVTMIKGVVSGMTRDIESAKMFWFFRQICGYIYLDRDSLSSPSTG